MIPLRYDAQSTKRLKDNIVHADQTTRKGVPDSRQLYSLLNTFDYNW